MSDGSKMLADIYGEHRARVLSTRGFPNLEEPFPSTVLIANLRHRHKSKEDLIRGAVKASYGLPLDVVAVIRHNGWQPLAGLETYSFWVYRVKDLVGGEAELGVLYEAIHHHGYSLAPHQAAVEILIAEEKKGGSQFCDRLVLSEPFSLGDGRLTLLGTKPLYPLGATLYARRFDNMSHKLSGDDRVYVCRKVS